MKPPTLYPLRKHEVIQITPSGRWCDACFAIVLEPKDFGCVAAVRAIRDGQPGDAPIRLAWEEFERLSTSGVDAIFVPEDR